MWKPEYEEMRISMIKIFVPNDNTNYEINAYASKVDYLYCHFELTLNIGVRKIPMIFGRTKDGWFIYFPGFVEGINIHRHQTDTETIEALSYLFDNETSALILATVNQFLRMEGEQKWYRTLKRSRWNLNKQAIMPF